MCWRQDLTGTLAAARLPQFTGGDVTTGAAGSAALSIAAATILTKLLTVDGTTSGLDADLLDGLNSTAFVKVADIVNDLTSGGTAVPLSAEQGKTLNQLVLAGVGTSTSYANIAARDAASNINNGDIAYVIDATADPAVAAAVWAYYFRSAGAWVKILDQDDVSASVANAVMKDGTVTMTANLPMGGFKLTGLAAGTGNGESVRWEQISAVGFSGSASDLGSGTLPNARLDAFGSGDATVAAGGGAITLANNAVTNAKAAQMATMTLKGNNTGATANASDLSVAAVKSMLAVKSFTSAATPPASPTPGDEWWDTTTETLNKYVDGTIQWIDISSA